jgi:predicted metal-dependent hydrolase
MARATLPGNPPVDILLRPSGRARRLSLRVSGLDGRVTVSYPRHASERQAMDFALEKAEWIRGQLARRPDVVRVGPGVAVPVEGRSLPIAASPGPGVRVEAGQLLAPPVRTGAAVAAFLKALARDRLAAASDRHAATLGRSFGRVTLRDVRSRWGSCSSAGDLMYSWRLVMAPPEVLDYVAAHEVAHLAHMHHGPDFWAEVRRLYGDHRAARGWLRREGSLLHRFRFTD